MCYVPGTASELAFRSRSNFRIITLRRATMPGCATASSRDTDRNRNWEDAPSSYDYVYRWWSARKNEKRACKSTTTPYDNKVQ